MVTQADSNGKSLRYHTCNVHDFGLAQTGVPFGVDCPVNFSRFLFSVTRHRWDTAHTIFSLPMSSSRQCHSKQAVIIDNFERIPLMMRIIKKTLIKKIII